MDHWKSDSAVDHIVFDLIQIGKFYLVLIYYRLLFNYFDISKGRFASYSWGE